MASRGASFEGPNTLAPVDRPSTRARGWRLSASTSRLAPPNLLSLLCLGVWLCGACDDGGNTKPAEDVAEIEQADEVSDTTAPVSDSTVRFDFNAAATDFFAFPYPNDLRVTASGGPDLGAFPDNGKKLLQDLKADIGLTSQGFSPHQAVYFAFEDAIEPSSVPDNAGIAISRDATVYLINLEKGSPAYGHKMLADVKLYPEAQTFHPANLLSIRPVYGFPLRTGELHAAVVTKRVEMSGHLLVKPNPLWEDMRTSVLPPAGVPAEVHAQTRKLLSDLDTAGIDPDDVLVATPFTVGDPALTLNAINAAVTALPFPIPSPITLAETTQDYLLYEGTFPLVEYLSGTPPFSDGEGRVVLESGAPVPVRTIDAKYSFTTPTMPVEVPEFALVVNVQDLGADRTSFAAREGAVLAAANIATISFEPPLSGSRNPTSTPSRELFFNLLLEKPITARGVLLQQAADQLQLLKLIELITIPPEISPVGIAIELQTDPLVMMGQGFGGRGLALTLGLEPRINSAVLSSSGGGYGLMLAQGEYDGHFFAAELAAAIGASSGEVLDESHPVIALLYQPTLDPVDPLNLAYRYHLQSVASPKDVLMFLGTKDTEASPASVMALAAAGRIPPVAPLQLASPIWGMAEMSPLDPPVQLNIDVANVTDCRRDPCKVTAGVVSYPMGPFVIYDSDDAQNRYTNFVSWALRDIPVILPTE